MADKITLAQFARNLGIDPATARQWKRRGKIVERDSGFELIAEAQREWLGIGGRDNATEPVQGDAGVTEPAPPYVRSSSGVTPERVAELRQEFEAKKAAAAPVTREDFEALQGEVAALRMALSLTNNSLIDSNNVVLALQTEVAFLRSRIGDQQAPAMTRTVSRGGPIDPPGPQWGA